MHETPAGEQWLMLEGYAEQSDRGNFDWSGSQQVLYVDSWFVETSQASIFIDKVRSAEARQLEFIVDKHGHTDCCYFAEIGHALRKCYHGHGEFSDLNESELDLRAVAATEGYMWEGSILDCSIDSSVSVTVPSSFVQNRIPLILGDEGPSWRTIGGQIVAFNTGRHSLRDSRGFLMSVQWLRKFLEDNSLMLVSILSWERRYLTEHYWRERHPYARGKWLLTYVGDRFTQCPLERECDTRNVVTDDADDSGGVHEVH